MQKTNISYLDFTWNPGCGCPLPVPSAGCAKCWARDVHDKRHSAYKAGKKLPVQYARPFHELQFFEDRLTDPLHRRKPTKIGVQFMGDLFAFPFEWVEKVMAVIEQCPQHTFMVLTKRPHIMTEYFNGLGKRFELSCCSNLHLGVTVESPDNVGRIDELIRTPAAGRFLSLEPLIGRIDLGKQDMSGIDKVIVGSESIGRRCGRKCDIQWVREIVQQCRHSNTKVHIKQLAIDGQLIKDVNLFPEGLKIQE